MTRACSVFVCSRSSLLAVMQGGWFISPIFHSLSLINLSSSHQFIKSTSELDKLSSFINLSRSHLNLIIALEPFENVEKWQSSREYSIFRRIITSGRLSFFHSRGQLKARISEHWHRQRRVGQKTIPSQGNTAYALIRRYGYSI